uniref:DNA helicase n=1 Tax=Heterorhabditis bacteriophora TaxID=37862 RepID=A0A1I7XI41_HETBA
MEAIDNTLTIDQRPVFNNSIQKENLINIFPTNGSNMNENGEINFVIETFDQYLLPSKSYLYLEGLLTKPDDSKLKEEDKVTLTNNAPMFLFDRVTYSLNGSQIENLIQNAIV